MVRVVSVPRVPVYCRFVVLLTGPFFVLRSKILICRTMRVDCIYKIILMVPGLDKLLSLAEFIFELDRLVVLGFPLDVGLIELCVIRLIRLLFLPICALEELQVL